MYSIYKQNTDKNSEKNEMIVQCTNEKREFKKFPFFCNRMSVFFVFNNMNKFESEVVILIKKLLPVTSRKSISVKGDEVIKLYDDENKLFIQPHSPYHSPFGYQKRNDISLYCPKLNIDWRIECKSRKKLTLLGEITIELNYINHIPEKLYCLVLSDTLINSYLLNQINLLIKEKNLTNKVWVGNIKKFKKLLKKHI